MAILTKTKLQKIMKLTINLIGIAMTLFNCSNNLAIDQPGIQRIDALCKSVVEYELNYSGLDCIIYERGKYTCHVSNFLSNYTLNKLRNKTQHLYLVDSIDNTDIFCNQLKNIIKTSSSGRKNHIYHSKIYIYKDNFYMCIASPTMGAVLYTLDKSQSVVSSDVVLIY